MYTINVIQIYYMHIHTYYKCTINILYVLYIYYIHILYIICNIYCIYIYYINIYKIYTVLYVHQYIVEEAENYSISLLENVHVASYSFTTNSI